jgi:hypothetical protein
MLKGQGGSTTTTARYAAVQLGQVGGLYEAVLALAIAVAVLALILGALGVLAAFGTIRNPAHYSTLKGLAISVLVVSVFLTVLVPAGQPSIIGSAPNSGAGLCTLTNTSTSPCSSFWGSGSFGGNNYGWGGDVGWYLILSSTILLFAALFVWRSSRMAPWGGAGQPAAPGSISFGAITPSVGPPAPIDRLVNLKAMADSGSITPQEFQDSKARLIGEITTSGSVGGTAVATRPEDDLRKLKGLNESGALTEAEYSELRKSVLLRV